MIKELIDAYRARLQATTQQDSLAVDLVEKEILGEIAQRRTEAAIIRQEQGWWRPRSSSRSLRRPITVIDLRGSANVPFQPS